MWSWVWQKMCYALTRRVPSKARVRVCLNQQCVGQHFGHVWIGFVDVGGVLLLNVLPANSCFRMLSKHMRWFMVAQIIVIFPKWFCLFSKSWWWQLWNNEVNLTNTVPIMLQFCVCRPIFGFAPMSLRCNEWCIPLQIVDPNMLDATYWFRTTNQTKLFFLDNT